MRITAKVDGRGADGVCAPAAAAHNVSNLPLFEAFYVSGV